MRAVKVISPWQFAAFRIVLGAYLALHFAFLLPWGPELFARGGLIPDAAINPVHGILANPLERWDAPAVVTCWLAAMLALSVMLAAGLLRRMACVLLWYGWACLFNRNNLISNPSIPYVGLILLLTALVPPGEPLALRLRRGAARGPWCFPRMVFIAAWALMAAGYTFSGLDKLLSAPSWRDGSAMMLLLHNPLARPGPLRDLMLLVPEWAMRPLTWGALAMEVLFLPLCLTRRTRLVAWTGMLGMHLGILAVIAFADLTFGMVMLHLFTFDPGWFPSRASRHGRHVVFYDGVCGLCHRTVQFLIGEDRDAVLAFAPLQGSTFEALRRAAPAGDADSLVYARDLGDGPARPMVRSAAVLGALADVGGFWRVVSWLRIVPRPLRDFAYDFVAARRYAWFGRSDECRLPTPRDRGQLLP
jgi:predicted DCC family thiol-disulfide oxidoreductase YuxK